MVSHLTTYEYVISRRGAWIWRLAGDVYKANCVENRCDILGYTISEDVIAACDALAVTASRVEDWQPLINRFKCPPEPKNQPKL